MPTVCAMIAARRFPDGDVGRDDPRPAVLAGIARRAESVPEIIRKAASIMPRGEVHWHEGMFLRQHHFLTEHRQLVRLTQLDEKWTLHHNWGLRSIQLNAEALGNFRFSVSELKARLRDGTLIEVPEDGPLPELDLKPALESNRKVTIHLGIPLLKSSHPNIAADGPSDNNRYYLITRQVDDENLGVNPQPIA